MISYADLHCDALTLEDPQKDFLHRINTQTSLSKWKKGGCFLQCFALFIRSNQENGWEKTLEYLAEYDKAKEEIKSARMIPILTIEDCGNADREERLKIFIERGVRICGITWNDENALGFPCGEKGGLKAYGKKAVDILLENGIYPDISHLSIEGANEVFESAKRMKTPVLATHSLCTEICAHKRNLGDEQIKKIADSGGVVGINFVPQFVGKAGIVAHIRHLIKVGGEEVVAIGSDFDGTENPIVKNAEEMPEFFEKLKNAGISSRVVEKLAYKNALRLFV